MERRYYRVDEAAELLHVPRTTLYYWISIGAIPSMKVGKLCRLEIGEVHKFQERVEAERAESLASTSRIVRRRGRQDRTALYIAKDDTGAIIYVGISSCWAHRWTDHARNGDLYDATASLEIQWFDSENEARVREEELIRSRQPLFNKAGVPGRVKQPVRRKRLPEPPPLQDRFFRPDEVADMLGVTKRVIYNWIEEGTIPSVRLTDKTTRIPARVVQGAYVVRRGRPLPGMRGRKSVNLVQVEN